MTISKCGTACAALLAAICTGAAASECRLESPAHRVTVIELYTSEGCSSCPPADRWLSGLPQQGVLPGNAVLLAFHVDYWNQLGWPDRFSSPQYSQRQREAASRSAAGFVYTPQVVVDGRDFRQARRSDGLGRRLADINRASAGARIRANIQRTDSVLQVSGNVELPDRAPASESRLWIASFENGLSTAVRAGENAGVRLDHDYVVRELAGPFPVAPSGRASFEHKVRIAPEWNVGRVGLALFVENARTGEILQAVSRYPLCPGS